MKDAMKPRHAEFEEDLKHVLHYAGSLERNAVGTYVNPEVEMKWRAYQRAYGASMRIMFMRMKERHRDAPFIIGRRKTSGNGFYFARTPYCHNKAESALEEANRLHVENDDQFFVFGLVAKTPSGSTQRLERKAKKAQIKLDLKVIA